MGAITASCISKENSYIRNYRANLTENAHLEVLSRKRFAKVGRRMKLLRDRDQCCSFVLIMLTSRVRLQ